MKKIITFILILCFTLSNAQNGEEAVKSLGQVIDKLESIISQNQKQIASLQTEIVSLKEQIKEVPDEVNGIQYLPYYEGNTIVYDGSILYLIPKGSGKVTIPLSKLESKHGLFVLYNEGNDDITIAPEGQDAITYRERKNITYYNDDGTWKELQKDLIKVESSNSEFPINGGMVRMIPLNISIDNIGGTYKILSTTYAPNLSSGQYLEQISGKEESLRNRYSAAFYYDGDRSLSNAYSILFYGAGESMRVDAKGDLTLKGSVKVNKKYKVNQLPKDGSINIAIVTDASNVKFRGNAQGGGNQEALVFYNSKTKKWIY